MPTQAEFGGIAERQAMAKVQQLAEITPNLPLTEYDFYEFFRTTFETSELGNMKRLLPLRKMADNLGLVRRGTMPRRSRWPYFTAEGKVALMFLKMYTGLSCPKLMGQLNGNIHYQMFCDVIIDPVNPLTNYRLLDGIILDIAGRLKIHKLSFTYSRAYPFRIRSKIPEDTRSRKGKKAVCYERNPAHFKYTCAKKAFGQGVRLPFSRAYPFTLGF